MLFIFASAGSIVETAYQFSQSDDKNGTNAVSCVPLHTPGSNSRTRLASKMPALRSPSLTTSDAVKALSSPFGLASAGMSGP